MPTKVAIPTSKVLALVMLGAHHPRHIVRWIGAFLLDRSQKVMIGSNCSISGSPNGGVPQGTLSGPKCCYCTYVNDLESNVPLYKYVDDSTLFEMCNTTDVSVM